MMARELGMRDGFAGGSAVRYMDTRPQQPEMGEAILCVLVLHRMLLLITKHYFQFSPSKLCDSLAHSSAELKEIEQSDSEPEYGDA
jgi:hypothetical protein